MRPGDLCGRPECRHPRAGAGPREGHFVGHRVARASQGGPCKVPGCSCTAFQAAAAKAQDRFRLSEWSDTEDATES